MLEDLTAATFDPLVGASFDVDGVLAVVLDRVTPAPTGFSLEFVGPADPTLTQGTFEFSHPELGTLPLFIVPIAPDADGARYEAVFNRAP
jgi:hypothetical protein